MMNPMGQCLMVEPPTAQQIGGQTRYPATPQMYRAHREISQVMTSKEKDSGYDPSDESETSDEMPQQKRGHRRSRTAKGTHGRPRKHHVMLNVHGKKVKASYWAP